MAPNDIPGNSVRPGDASRGGDRLAQLLRLVELEPTDAFCLYGVAQEYARRGQHAEAVAWYDRCLAADPNYCYAYYHQAKAFEEADRIDDAVAALKAGLARATSVGDRQAQNEIAAYLDQLT